MFGIASRAVVRRVRGEIILVKVGPENGGGRQQQWNTPLVAEYRALHVLLSA